MSLAFVLEIHFILMLLSLKYFSPRFARKIGVGDQELHVNVFTVVLRVGHELLF